MFTKLLYWLGPPILVLVLAGIGWLTRDHWMFFDPAASAQPSGHDSGHDDPHAGHAHAEDGNRLSLSEKARKNLGLQVGKAQLSDYWRVFTVPGAIIERPGLSDHGVTTTFTGIVRKVHVLPGQAVHWADPLFELQLADEALAATQAQLLQSLQELEIIDMELERITPLVAEGAMPQKTKLEHEYNQKRLEATKHVREQELLVRGLTPEQVEEIVSSKKLLRTITIYAPEAHLMPSGWQEASSKRREEDDSIYTVESLQVHLGKHVKPGQQLCQLALHGILYIQGQAFEKEAEAIAQTIDESWPITAVFEIGEGKGLERDDLHILYIDNVVESASRTFRFYLPLVNEVVHETRAEGGRIFRTWRFKPGQKVRLRVPIEKWRNRFVLPADAVVWEGPSAFVFLRNGNLFERREVQVQYSGDESVIVANDGSIFPGDIVALSSAYQLHLALKKASGKGGGGHGHDH